MRRVFVASVLVRQSLVAAMLALIVFTSASVVWGGRARSAGGR